MLAKLISDIITCLSEDKIARFFLFYMTVVLALNILKTFFIWKYKNLVSNKYPCEHLLKNGAEQKCSHPAYEVHFNNNNNSCNGCFGRSIKHNYEDIERSVKKSGVLKALIISLANMGKISLPYASIVFTLLSKI